MKVQAFVASPLTPFLGLCTPDSHVAHLRDGEGPGAAPGHLSILEGLGMGSWDKPGLGRGAGSSYLVCGHWSSG